MRSADGLAQTEKPKNSPDNDDQAYNIDDVIHGVLRHVKSFIERVTEVLVPAAPNMRLEANPGSAFASQY